jgi:hypothetical protein
MNPDPLPQHRHPAIPTPRPLSGAIHPILTPQILAKTTPSATSRPASDTRPPDKPQD